MYVVVYQSGTDGDPQMITKDSPEAIASFVKTQQLTPDDYAIIQGSIIKSFDSQNPLKVKKVNRSRYRAGPKL